MIWRLNATEGQYVFDPDGWLSDTHEDRARLESFTRDLRRTAEALPADRRTAADPTVALYEQIAVSFDDFADATAVGDLRTQGNVGDDLQAAIKKGPAALRILLAGFRDVLRPGEIAQIEELIGVD